MEHQYPGAISGDENMLAELMLPDQAHVRNQDWTIFFLHKDTSDEEEAGGPNRPRKERKEHKEQTNAALKDSHIDFDTQDEVPETVGDATDEDEEEEEERDEKDKDGIEGPPLIYVLNLVNTKQDNTARRYFDRYR